LDHDGVLDADTERPGVEAAAADGDDHVGGSLLLGSGGEESPDYKDVAVGQSK